MIYKNKSLVLVFESQEEVGEFVCLFLDTCLQQTHTSGSGERSSRSPAVRGLHELFCRGSRCNWSCLPLKLIIFVTNTLDKGSSAR